MFAAQDLEQIFAACFAEDYRTRLIGEAEEPLYQPAAGADGWHLLYYREDYFASALHEIAHWCIAGSERRQKLDFGYWYHPDGRTAEQQAAFERVEVLPQALEYSFARACCFPFRVSIDNLGNPNNCSRDFRHAIYRQARELTKRGLPARGTQFYQALASFYGGPLEYRHLTIRAEDFER